MDWNEIWQRNKRFLAGVAGGALLFLMGLLLIRSFFGAELAGARRTKARLERELGEPRFDAAAREAARDDNAALVSARDELADTVAFRARADFALPEGGASAVNHYHRTVARVREALLTSAGRANLLLDPDLGLPDLSPASDEAIARYLDALDAVERLVGLAIDAGVERIDDVRIRLDPRLESRRGVGAVERTRVELELAGSGRALAQFLERTQRPSDEGAGALVVPAFELRQAKRAADGARLELSIDLVRLHALEEDTP